MDHMKELSKLEQLEADLRVMQPASDQLTILERLVGYYIYTDISKAVGPWGANIRLLVYGKRDE